MLRVDSLGLRKVFVILEPRGALILPIKCDPDLMIKYVSAKPLALAISLRAFPDPSMVVSTHAYSVCLPGRFVPHAEIVPVAVLPLAEFRIVQVK